MWWLQCLKYVLKDLEAELTHDCEEGEEAFTKNYSQQLCDLYELNSYGKWREEVVMSPCHGRKISGSQQTVVLQIHVWQKKTEKTDMYDFLEHDCAQDKMVAHIFLSSYDNGCLCEERLLRSINFAAMVMWRHTSLYWLRFKSWGFLLLTAPHIVFLIRDLFSSSWHFQARIKINNRLQQLFLVWLLPRSLPVPVQLHLFPRSCSPRVSGLCLKRICIKPVQIGQLHLLRAKQE